MKESCVKLIGMPRIVKSAFELNENYDYQNKKNVEINLNLQTEINENEEQNNLFLYKVILDITTNEENPMFKLNMIINGIFEIQENIEEYKEILNISGAAILISFARPYITNITAAAGIEPIILPLLNLKEN